MDDELQSAVAVTNDGEQPGSRDRAISFPIIQSPQNAIMSRTIQKDDQKKTYQIKLHPFPSNMKVNGAESHQEVMSAATNLVQAPNQAKVNPYAYVAEKSKRSEGIRAHQLSARLVDMTHDTLPEVKWRPVEKRVDKIPGQQILEDKVLLRDWE